jgi:hypothetical protein
MTIFQAMIAKLLVGDGHAPGHVPQPPDAWLHARAGKTPNFIIGIPAARLNRYPGRGSL